MSEQPNQPPSGAVVSASMRTQRQGRVVAVLDGDAHIHVWEPNRLDDPIDVDLTDQLAAIIDVGLDAPPAPEPHWTDRSGTTVIVSLDPGERGNVTARGHTISLEAAVRLAANGFMQLLRTIAERASDETADEDDQPDTTGAADPEPDDGGDAPE